VSMHTSERQFGPSAAVPVSRPSTETWVAKAAGLATPLLGLAGPVADPSAVEPLEVGDPAEWPYGRFMLAWLDSAGPVRHVRHLPDASFFLRLLGRAYAPVFATRPELAELLLDDSRPEMSLTNDVLQLQLRSAPHGAGYSMVRNHALMLFIAALWLDEPQRTGWLDLYDELVSYVDSRPGGRPGLDELAAVEEGAFDDFVELAPLTIDPVASEKLLRAGGVLDRILDYQLYAGVAIGLLWREYRDLPESAREAWFRTQLSELYGRSDYLDEKWMNR
jgi:hypothetical protein